MLLNKWLNNDQLKADYNLGHNKMEQQTPIPRPPTQTKDEATQKPTAPFSHAWFGGGRGTNFPSILCKMVGDYF